MDGPVVVFGVLLLAVGLFLTLMPTTVARLDQAKQRAVLGRQTSATRYRPVAQRVAGGIPVVVGIVVIVVGLLHH